MFKNSNEIKVFPTSRRNNENDRQARFNTESNLVNIINRLVKQPSFIIEGFNYENGEMKPGKCNIGGYYFNIETPTVLLSASGSNDLIYFEIATETTGGYVEITGGDSGGTYKGLEIKLGSSSNVTNTNRILPVLQYIDNNWEIVEMSMLPYSVSQIMMEQNESIGNTTTQPFETFLENDYIIDDGEL